MGSRVAQPPAAVKKSLGAPSQETAGNRRLYECGKVRRASFSLTSATAGAVTDAGLATMSHYERGWQLEDRQRG